MRYRQLDANGDFLFGQNSANFLVDTPATVAQAVQTRLGIIEGEWFLDITIGTPYNTEILGAGTVATYDAAIQEVILDTPGVSGIAIYSSSFNPITRAVSINCTIDTIYGQAELTTSVPTL